MSIQFSSITADNGQQFVTVLVDGQMQPPVDNTHPNFSHIIAICTASMAGEPVDTQAFIDLFDVAATVTRKFERLTERVAVKDGVITLDGDPVNGALQEQILSFVDAGEDFGPLVDFYEKLLTNPLGDVREGLYTWLNAQGQQGAVTITDDGDLLGYKGVYEAEPEWRKDETTVYVPSRRGEGVVNGRDVSSNELIEQVIGDVVEMPRSKVLHEPSRECGTGLHIGTWDYASTFGDGTTLLVRFSPRDIVSLPDSNSSWKLRVCRYTVVDVVDEALTVPVYQTAEPQDDAGEIDVVFPDEVKFGLDEDQIDERDIVFGNPDANGDVLEVGDTIEIESWDGTYETVVTGFDEDGDPLYDDEDGDEENDYADNVTKVHGKGGPTSQAAKGRGLNPAQDPKTGRFVQGRPGSSRDTSTGRFA